MKRLNSLFLILLIGTIGLSYGQGITNVPKVVRCVRKSAPLLEHANYSYVKYPLSTCIERGWRYWEMPNLSNSHHNWNKYYYDTFDNSKDNTEANRIKDLFDIIDTYNNKMDDCISNYTFDTIIFIQVSQVQNKVI